MEHKRKEIKDMVIFYSLDEYKGIKILALISKKDKIKIPDYIDNIAVTSIDNSCFSTYKYKEIILPKFLKKIGSFAFYGACEITSIEIPETIISIGYYSFHKNVNIIIPHKKIKFIGGLAVELLKETTHEKYIVYECLNFNDGEKIFIGKIDNNYHYYYTIESLLEKLNS